VIAATMLNQNEISARSIAALNKLDYSVAGRYLAYRIRRNDHVTLSGIDLDVGVIADAREGGFSI
jgi:hypothetical protein